MIDEVCPNDYFYGIHVFCRCLINTHLKDLREDFLLCGSKITYWNKVKAAMIETFPDFDKSAEQVREKWRNLEKTYRAKKKAAEKSGAGKITWPFFHQIDAEMGDRDDITLDGMTTIGGRVDCSSASFIF